MKTKYITEFFTALEPYTEVLPKYLKLNIDANTDRLQWSIHVLDTEGDSRACLEVDMYFYGDGNLEDFIEKAIQTIQHYCK